jgi:hypothetical protein
MKSDVLFKSFSESFVVYLHLYFPFCSRSFSGNINVVLHVSKRNVENESKNASIKCHGELFRTQRERRKGENRGRDEVDA